MKVTNTQVYGLERAILTSRYPKIVDIDEYWKEVNIKDLQLWIDNGLKAIDSILNKSDKYRLVNDIVYMKIKDIDIAFSPQDLPLIDSYNWTYITTNGYVVGYKDNEKFYLHQVISNTNGRDIVADHIDRNTFNNTRTNLRICSHRENSINASLNKKNTSGVIGVAWKKDKKKWKAYISTNYKQIHLGYFEDKNSAILARLNAEKEYFKEFAPQRHLFYKYNIDDIEVSHLPKYPDITEYLRAYRCLKTLSNTGGAEGHEQALTGITVTFDLTTSMQFWPEFQRYTFANFISSTSKMHKLSKMSISKCCNEWVDSKMIDIASQYQDMYNKDFEKYKKGELPKEKLDESFYKMVYNIPLGFELAAGMTTNYRCLRNIYRQRRNHRLEEWQVFCDWIESLPMSDELITVGLKEGRNKYKERG